MASNFLIAQADLAANTDNVVFTIDVNRTINILICNRTASPVNIKIGLLPNGTSSTSTLCWIDYAVPLDANCALERNGLPLGAGDKIIVNPGAAGISCSVVGIPI